MSRYLLDARHLLCPLPVIRTQSKIAELADGDTLEVIATDPGASHDVPAWCRIQGHEVAQQSVDNGEVRIIIEIRKTLNAQN